MSKRSVDNYSQHYVYRMSHPCGWWYVGVHSSNDAYADKYRGSGKQLNEDFKTYPKKEWRKEIIQIFSRRVDAEYHEGLLVTHKELADPMCRNRCLGGVRKR